MHWFTAHPGRVATVLLGASLALSACGGSTPKATSSTTTEVSASGATSTTVASASGSRATTTSPSHATKGKPKKTVLSPTASQLNTLLKSLQSGQTASFKAVYSSSFGGSTVTFGYEQTSQRSLFTVGTSEILNTSAATYNCSTSGAPVCQTFTPKDPLASSLDLVSGKSTLTALQAGETALAAKTKGYTASFTSQTFAGQAATCVTVTGPATSAAPGKFCVTGTGALAYVSTSATQILTLTSYSSGVAASDFDLPPGAQVITNPQGQTSTTVGNA